MNKLLFTKGLPISVPGYGKEVKWYKREGVGGCLRAPQSRLHWMDEFCPQKEGSHVVDNCCGTGNFMTAGVSEWLYDG